MSRLISLPPRPIQSSAFYCLVRRVRALAGKTPTARFRIELICIVDTIDKGILVYRDLKRSILLPASPLFHWAKRFFERHYLRVFRR